MLPLNYAILAQFAHGEEADADTVMGALAGAYSSARQFTKKAVVEALMTAHANGLLDETRFDLDDRDQLRIYYQATDSGRDMIHRYIGV
ncbi:MAG: hypothetical protein FWD75_08420 [Propionibacteriaceae bacterium]|nr:hypothetical protein [Propionibacteriaceae bacterium]